MKFAAFFMIFFFLKEYACQKALIEKSKREHLIESEYSKYFAKNEQEMEDFESELRKVNKNVEGIMHKLGDGERSLVFPLEIANGRLQTKLSYPDYSLNYTIVIDLRQSNLILLSEFYEPFPHQGTYEIEFHNLILTVQNSSDSFLFENYEESFTAELDYLSIIRDEQSKIFDEEGFSGIMGLALSNQTNCFLQNLQDQNIIDDKIIGIIIGNENLGSANKREMIIGSYDLEERGFYTSDVAQWYPIEYQLNTTTFVQLSLELSEIQINTYKYPEKPNSMIYAYFKFDEEDIVLPKKLFKDVMEIIETLASACNDKGTKCECIDLIYEEFPFFKLYDMQDQEYVYTISPNSYLDINSKGSETQCLIHLRAHHERDDVIYLGLRFFYDYSFILNLNNATNPLFGLIRSFDNESLIDMTIIILVIIICFVFFIVCLILMFRYNRKSIKKATITTALLTKQKTTKRQAEDKQMEEDDNKEKKKAKEKKAKKKEAKEEKARRKREEKEKKEKEKKKKMEKIKESRKQSKSVNTNNTANSSKDRAPSYTSMIEMTLP